MASSIPATTTTTIIVTCAVNCGVGMLQIEAISEGFLSVVPSAALRLNTWHEIEKRVCGEPEIAFEDLKAASMFHLLFCSEY